MDWALSTEQIQHYQAQGYLSPVTAFTAQEASALRVQLEAFEAVHCDKAKRTDIHLLETWAWDCVHNRRILDPVVSLLGPDVLLWSVQWFIKEPQDEKFVSLHQDANYWGLEPHDVLTAWIALSDASEATGPMGFVPGSHRGELYAHENTFAANNLLSRGQTAKVDGSTLPYTLAPLAAGQMSLHHVRLLHGSGPNQTDDRRIGMVLRFCGTHVRQTKAPDTAVLVAGQDAYGHFQLQPAPNPNDPAGTAQRHAYSAQQLAKIVMMD